MKFEYGVDTDDDQVVDRFLQSSLVSSYRIRAHRFNGESCLLDVARLQEVYFSRHNQYATDMKTLGYSRPSAAECPVTGQYLLSTRSVDTENCPSSHCYHLSAVPIGTQAEDGVLHLRYDASQAEPGQRLRKERIAQGSSKPWD